MEIALIGLVGVVIGAMIVGIVAYVFFKTEERRYARHRELENRVKEVETLVLLNKKINEILTKRTVVMEQQVRFNSFDDCYITIDDYVYLQSFTAQNSFHLPNFLVEEFFKNISHRKVVLSPEETVKISGYVYTGGRIVMESFSEELIEIIQEKKKELTRLGREPLRYFDMND